RAEGRDGRGRARRPEELLDDGRALREERLEVREDEAVPLLREIGVGHEVAVERAPEEQEGAIARDHDRGGRREAPELRRELVAIARQAHRAEAHREEQERRLGAREREGCAEEAEPERAAQRRGELVHAADEHAEPDEEREVERRLEAV